MHALTAEFCGAKSYRLLCAPLTPQYEYWKPNLHLLQEHWNALNYCKIVG